MPRYSKHGFMLLIVLLLLSLAVVAELLAARYLVDLGRHVHQRQQVIQQRITLNR